MGSFVYWLLTLYMVILAGRAVLSWFPVRGGTFLASLNTLLFELTEPVLRPVRTVIPPVGMFDTSFIIVFFVRDHPAHGGLPVASGGFSILVTPLATMGSHGCHSAGTPW